MRNYQRGDKIKNDVIKFKEYTFIYSKILYYIMVADKPIKISGATKKGLDKLKTHPRETYDDVITRLVEEGEDVEGDE